MFKCLRQKLNNKCAFANLKIVDCFFKNEFISFLLNKYLVLSVCVCVCVVCVTSRNKLLNGNFVNVALHYQKEESNKIVSSSFHYHCLPKHKRKNRLLNKIKTNFFSNIIFMMIASTNKHLNLNNEHLNKVKLNIRAFDSAIIENNKQTLHKLTFKSIKNFFLHIHHLFCVAHFIFVIRFEKKNQNLNSRLAPKNAKNKNKKNLKIGRIVPTTVIKLKWMTLIYT